MLRWLEVEDKTLFGMTVKMYREPFRVKESFIAPEKNKELDLHAFKYLQSELLMYRIMDTNWDSYIEARGDIDNLPLMSIPTVADVTKSVL